VELYDLEADPGETHDVVGEHADIVACIEAAMDSAHVRSALFPLLPSERTGH